MPHTVLFELFMMGNRLGVYVMYYIIKGKQSIPYDGACPYLTLTNFRYYTGSFAFRNMKNYQ